VDAPTGNKKCPFCAETIRREAIVCRFCKRDIHGTNEPAQSNRPGNTVLDGVKLGVGMLIVLPLTLLASILGLILIVGSCGKSSHEDKTTSTTEKIQLEFPFHLTMGMSRNETGKALGDKPATSQTGFLSWPISKKLAYGRFHPSELSAFFPIRTVDDAVKDKLLYVHLQEFTDNCQDFRNALDDAQQYLSSTYAVTEEFDKPSPYLKVTDCLGPRGAVLFRGQNDQRALLDLYYLEGKFAIDLIYCGATDASKSYCVESY